MTTSSSIDYFGTARARVGYAFDRALIYATGGVAWGHNNANISVPLIPFSISDDQTHFGWTAGAGLEYAVLPNWSMKIEYQYTQYSKENYFTALIPGGIQLDAEVSTVKVGVNYPFN